MYSIRLAVGAFGVFVFALLIAVFERARVFGRDGATGEQCARAAGRGPIERRAGAAGRGLVWFSGGRVSRRRPGDRGPSVFKTDSRDPVSTGSLFTYTLYVFNDGPDAATNVIVTDPLPPGVTPVTVTTSRGSVRPTRSDDHLRPRVDA